MARLASLAYPIMALLLFVYLLTASREPPWADAHVVYDTTAALVNRGELNVNTPGAPYFFTFRNGKKYGYGSLGNVLALVPSYLTYRALHNIPGLGEPWFFALCSHLSSALLMAGAGGIFFVLCRRRGASARCATLGSLTLGLGTLCFCYARSPYSEALQTVGLLWVLERTLAQGEKMTVRGMIWLGAAVGVLFNAKLVYALAMPPCAVYLVYRALGQPLEVSPRPNLRRHLEKQLGRRLGRHLEQLGPSLEPYLAQHLAQHPEADKAGLRERIWLLGRGGAAALGGFLPLLALALWHNRVKTGSLWQTGYQGNTPLFSGDLGAGLYGFLLSSGKGMFFYSPPLLLGLLGLRTSWRRLRSETALILSMGAIVMGFSAKFSVWHGGYCWGPRYMAPLTPLLLLLALPWLPEALARGQVRLRRWAVAALLAGGLGIQALGASFYWDHYIRVLAQVRDETERPGWSEDHYAFGYFVPEFSPIPGHLWLLRHLWNRDPDLNRDAPWRNLLSAKLNLAGTWTRLRLDWWALEWLRVPATQAAPLPPAIGSDKARRAGGVLLGLFLCGALLSGAALWRRLRRAGPETESSHGEMQGGGSRSGG